VPSLPATTNAPRRSVPLGWLSWQSSGYLD